MPRIALRVVCGVGEVMDTLLSQIVLRRVDLPDDGLPIMATDAHFMVPILSVMSPGFNMKVACLVLK